MRIFIHLLKASSNVKSKALDKLKETYSSKGGETNAKAQEYLDALLNIKLNLSTWLEFSNISI